MQAKYINNMLHVCKHERRVTSTPAAIPHAAAVEEGPLNGFVGSFVVRRTGFLLPVRPRFHAEKWKRFNLRDVNQLSFSSGELVCHTAALSAPPH